MMKVVLVNREGSSSERVYALDALRAIMMLLGIVIHAAVTYSNTDYKTAWGIKDPDNNAGFGILVNGIQSFNMPVFFITAGYFAALMYYKKGPGTMLLNRFRRIILPFLAGVLIVYPLVVMAFTFSIASFAGAGAPSGEAWAMIISGKFLPFNVAHLWFLYFLAIYCFIAWLLARSFSKYTRFTIAIQKLFTYILRDFWLRLMIMVILYFACLFWMDSTVIKTSNTWSIDPAIFSTYFIFFGMGWMVYRTNSLISLASLPFWQLGIGMGLFLYASFIPWKTDPWIFHAKQLFTAMYGTIFTFGIMAFFLSYFNHYSRKLSMLMDASYWMYLIHLPLVALIPGLMAELHLPALVKFTITLSGHLDNLLCQLQIYGKKNYYRKVSEWQIPLSSPAAKCSWNGGAIQECSINNVILKY